MICLSDCMQLLAKQAKDLHNGSQILETKFINYFSTSTRVLCICSSFQNENKQSCFHSFPFYLYLFHHFASSSKTGIPATEQRTILIKLKVLADESQDSCAVLCHSEEAGTSTDLHLLLLMTEVSHKENGDELPVVTLPTTESYLKRFNNYCYLLGTC